MRYHEIIGSRTWEGTATFSQSRKLPRDNRAGKNAIAIWICLIGLIIPAADIQIYIAGAKFTVGRFFIALLFFPAIVIMSRSWRKIALADVMSIATAAWIIIAASLVGGEGTLSSAAAESLEIFGGFIAARAFIFGPNALHEFVRVLKVLMIVTIIFAITENLSGKLLVHDFVASIFGVTPPDPQYRNGVLRAMATFDHAILFGAFCCATGIIILYAESSPTKRAAYVALCAFGCFLSLSSSSLLSLSFALFAYTYDRTMQRYSWRWSAFCALVALPVVGLFAVSANPLDWLIAHLTLDPESGYFRELIWHAAFERLDESPWIGFGFNPLDSDILDATVDSVWLVFALRFGLPMIVLFLLSNLTTFLAVKRGRVDSHRDLFMERMSTAFTMVLVTFMFIGLTVHFWNYMWIFWGVCIGIRASLREWILTTSISVPTRLASVGMKSKKA